MINPAKTCGHNVTWTWRRLSQFTTVIWTGKWTNVTSHHPGHSCWCRSLTLLVPARYICVYYSSPKSSHSSLCKKITCQCLLAVVPQKLHINSCNFIILTTWHTAWLHQNITFRITLMPVIWNNRFLKHDMVSTAYNKNALLLPQQHMQVHQWPYLVLTTIHQTASTGNQSPKHNLQSLQQLLLRNKILQKVHQ